MEPLSMKHRNEQSANACIWMQAGVVKKKACAREYDCPACRFDKIMQRTAEVNRRTRLAGQSAPGKRARIVSWKDKLLERPAWKRPCLHHMKGRIDFRSCTADYHCGRCEFDQYFNDQYSVHALVRPVDVRQVAGFKIPQGYYLHRGHTWLKIEEGNEVRVGLDDFALRLLGPLSTMRSPLMGKKVRQGRADLTIQRGDHQAHLMSPVTGVITAVNADLRETASDAGAEPYAGGWIATVHADNLRSELRHLMIGDESEQFLKKEIDKLYDVIEQETGQLAAADGGQLGTDIYGHLPEDSWERLTKAFLRT